VTARAIRPRVIRLAAVPVRVRVVTDEYEEPGPAAARRYEAAGRRMTRLVNDLSRDAIDAQDDPILAAAYASEAEKYWLLARALAKEAEYEQRPWTPRG